MNEMDRPLVARKLFVMLHPYNVRVIKYGQTDRQTAGHSCFLSQ